MIKQLKFSFGLKIMYNTKLNILSHKQKLLPRYQQQLQSAAIILSRTFFEYSNLRKVRVNISQHTNFHTI